MTFTDEQLADWKEGPLTPQMKAFIARLEAAEKLVSWEWDNGDYQELLKAWRKACGCGTEK